MSIGYAGGWLNVDERCRERFGIEHSVAEVKIIKLVDRRDNRGSSFAPPAESIAFLTAVRNVHLTTLRPGHVRGNHYHRRQREILFVISSGPWEVHWDTGIGTHQQIRLFSDPGAVLLQIEPLASHAIRNIGTTDLTILACTDQPYDPQDPDSHPRQLVEIGGLSGG